ncbi:MAG: hypothetical protein AB1668_02105 [Nanoarchaeota archaeon]
MVKHFLITRPQYDKETSYMYSFSKPIMAIAKENRSIHVTELRESNACRKKVEMALTRTKPRLIFLNGHGDEKSVWGQQDEPILDKDNAALTKNGIVYALACSSLAELGQIAVDEGADAYIGYEREFRWVIDLSRTSSPEKDKNAAPFRRVCFVLGKNLLSGTSAEESIKRTKEEYEKLIRNYGSSEDYFGDAPLIGLGLSWDLLFLGMRGNPKAVF